MGNPYLCRHKNVKNMATITKRRTATPFAKAWNHAKKLDNSEKLQLTDWEYSGMQDPHVDIAMFCIYSLYNKQEVDRLIDIYFENKCNQETRAKIYAYIAACGLLWSNWCEFKATLGVEFGEYSLRQYRFAKDYYRYAKQEMPSSYSQEE